MRTFVSYQSTKRVKKTIEQTRMPEHMEQGAAGEVYRILTRLGIGEPGQTPEPSRLKTPSGWARKNSLTVLWSGTGVDLKAENPAAEVLADLLELMAEEPRSLESSIRLWVYEHPGDYVLAVMSTADPKKVILAGRVRELAIGKRGQKVLVCSDRSQAMSYAAWRLRNESCQVAVIDGGGSLYLDKPEEGKLDPLVREIRWNREQLEAGLSTPALSKTATPSLLENISDDLIVIDSGRGELRVWWKQSESQEGPVCIWKCLSA